MVSNRQAHVTTDTRDHGFWRCDPSNLCGVLAIYPNLKLRPKDSRTRRAAIEKLHSVFRFQPAGLDDGHTAWSYFVRIPPNDFHMFPTSRFEKAIAAPSRLDKNAAVVILPSSISGMGVATQCSAAKVKGWDWWQYGSHPSRSGHRKRLD